MEKMPPLGNIYFIFYSLHECGDTNERKRKELFVVYREKLRSNRNKEVVEH